MPELDCAFICTRKYKMLGNRKDFPQIRTFTEVNSHSVTFTVTKQNHHLHYMTSWTDINFRTISNFIILPSFT